MTGHWAAYSHNPATWCAISMTFKEEAAKMGLCPEEEQNCFGQLCYAKLLIKNRLYTVDSRIQGNGELYGIKYAN